MTILENNHLRVEISDLGAELQSIRAAGAEWLWQGDATWWTGRAPLLFPVVGQSPGGRLEVEGASYPMASHGFARISRFTRHAVSDSAVTYLLEESEETRACYPFRFQLWMTIRLDGPHLHCGARVVNRDGRDMPFQFGFHPAFVLPWSAGAVQRVGLANGATPLMLRPVAGGLMGEELMPSPFVEGQIGVTPALFEEGAMVFPDGAGERFIYESDHARVEMEVTNLPIFALWQKPGAPFLCLEPWQGMAPNASQGAGLRERSGCLVLPPGGAAEFTMSMRVSDLRGAG